MEDQIQYLSADSLATLKKEYDTLRDKTIPEIAKRIDEAKQQGDLSENAEYHQAREDMSWAKGRLIELEQIINNSQIIDEKAFKSDKIGLGSNVKVKINDKIKEYTIVGAQESEPGKGKISNESPLGEAFIGHKKGDKVTAETPAGKQLYHILEVN